MINVLAFFVGFIIGMLISYVYDRKSLQKYWERHAIQKKAVIMATIPFVFLVLWPMDKVKYGTTLKDYYKTYKNLFISDK